MALKVSAALVQNLLSVRSVDVVSDIALGHTLRGTNYTSNDIVCAYDVSNVDTMVFSDKKRKILKSSYEFNKLRPLSPEGRNYNKFVDLINEESIPGQAVTLAINTRGVSKISGLKIRVVDGVSRIYGKISGDIKKNLFVSPYVLVVDMDYDTFGEFCDTLCRHINNYFDMSQDRRLYKIGQVKKLWSYGQQITNKIPNLNLVMDSNPDLTLSDGLTINLKTFLFYVQVYAENSRTLNPGMGLNKEFTISPRRSNRFPENKIFEKLMENYKPLIKDLLETLERTIHIIFPYRNKSTHHLKDEWQPYIVALGCCTSRYNINDKTSFLNWISSGDRLNTETGLPLIENRHLGTERYIRIANAQRDTFVSLDNPKIYGVGYNKLSLYPSMKGTKAPNRIIYRYDIINTRSIYRISANPVIPSQL